MIWSGGVLPLLSWRSEFAAGCQHDGSQSRVSQQTTTLGRPVMRPARFALLASISVFATAPAFAQAPQVEKNISMAMSLAILRA
jgi:hypothetical protein